MLFLILIVPNAIETAHTFLNEFLNSIWRTGFSDVPLITFRIFSTWGNNPTFVVPNARVIVPNAIETSYMLPFQFYNSDWFSWFSSLNSIRFMNKNTYMKSLFLKFSFNTYTYYSQPTSKMLFTKMKLFPLWSILFCLFV